MRFIVDESTGRAVAEVLRNHGHDVLYVHDWNAGVDDPDILEIAVRERRIVITNDKDFGELVYRSGMPHVGIVLFRLQDEARENRVRIMLKLLRTCQGKFEGNFITATEVKVRIRS